ncbi:MAG: hypothetical protein MI861_21615, partial [Pirellulales bacterium]|nr:hypothetical protein [Pirellulales bacterium]
MKRIQIITGCGILAVAMSMSARAANDWPVWRGPNANGVADQGQAFPVQWDENTNVIWKSPIPGRGHSSPIVVGDRILLTTADERS